MAKNTALRTEIVITCNAKNADNEIKNIKKSIKALDKEINDLQKQGKGDTPYAKWLRKLRGSLNNFQRESVKGAERIKSAVENLAGTSTNELRRARRAAQQFRDSLAANDKQFAQANANLAKIQAQIDKNTGAVHKHGSAWKTTIKNMMAYVGVFGALNLVKSKIEEIISMNNKLSDQMANIRKVSNLPMGDIKNLTKTIYGQDTRTNPNEMMDIAYAGAKLGMGNGGIDQLAAFTRSANVVNVALKEDMGPEALTALSKIVENMGLIKSMGVEESMNKVGSAMFRLASTSTATSSNIVEFARRLTAMARVAGITTDQLLALGSASDSMYLAPEVAATAFTKLFSSLQTNHNLIEKTLTIPPGTINSYFKQGEAMKAVVLIFQKMHDMGNMNALKPIFKDLGSDGARLMNVMTAMAKNVDMLKEHLNTSNEAYKEGTAVLDEYNIQQQTSQALIERANNLWQKTFINPDNVDVVHEFAQGWYDITKSFTSSQIVVATLKWALEGLMTLLKGILFILPSIIMGFGAQGLVLTMTKLVGVITNLGTALRKAYVAYQALNFATKANIWVAVGSAVAFVAAKILEVATSSEKATGFMEGFDRSLRGAGGAIADSVAELESYRRAIENAAIGTERRNLAISNFNKKFGTYLSKLLTEKATAKDLALAYEEVNNALQKKAYLELRDKDMKQQIVPRAGHERNLGMEYDNLISGTSSAGFNSAYLRKFWQENRGKTFDQMAYMLNQAMFNTPLNDVTYNRVRYLDKNSSTDVIPDEINKKVRNVYTDKNGKRQQGNKFVANAQSRFFLALRYLRTYGGLQNAVTQVDRKYQGLNLDSNPQQDDLGSLDNMAEDKDAKKTAKAAAAKARAERAKKIRDANERFKNAKEEATAVVSAIDEYYTLQKEAIEQMYNDGKITRVKADNLKLWLENRRLQIQVEAHKALGGRDNQFEDLKKQIGWGYDRVDQSSNSDASEQIIRRFNGPATYKLLASFSGGDGMPDGRSVINDINKKGAEMKLKLTEANGKVIKAVNDYFNQFNVVKDVSDDLAQQLTDMGVVFEKPRNFFKGQEADHKDKQELDPSAIELQDVTVSAAAPDSTQMKLLQSFIQNGNKNYGFDAKDSDKLGDWLKEFVTGGEWNAREDSGTIPSKLQFRDWAKVMPDMENWVKDIPRYQQQIQSFYISLLNAEDSYYNKMKANTDREKRTLDERFNRSNSGVRYNQEERDLQVIKGIQSIYGRGETGAFLNTQEMARNNGFADNITNDPEVMLAEEQMRKMQEKLEMARQTEKDQQAIQNAERAAQDAELAYADKINQQIKARIDLLQQWVDPLQEFSEAMGDAFVKMTESAEEGRDAMKEATQNMVKTFAKMTIDMIAQQLKMEVQRALFHKKMLSSETDYQKGMQDANEKGHKSIFKALGSFFKKRKKDKNKAATDENKQEKDMAKKGTDIVKDAASTELKTKTEVATKGAEITQQMDQKSSEAKVETAAADAQTTGAETQGNIFAGIASGAAKIIGKLGWWGIPLIAVIQGLLMGLLNSALGKLFGGKQKPSASTNTKLVSGMLTYDSGNVEAFSGAIDKKTYPVVGNDGKVYAAKPTDKLVTGLLTEPVATTVNGVPSLIAERGPEMIIGRETTQALMMARPDIISEIVRFDRNHSGKAYRAYDSGNIAEVVSNLSTPSVSTSQQQVTQADFADFVSTMRAMAPIMQAFTRQLQQPLKTSINMYGNGGLYDSMSRASKFMSGRG